MSTIEFGAGKWENNALFLVSLKIVDQIGEIIVDKKGSVPL